VTEGEDPEDQKVQRSLEESDAIAVRLGRHSTRICAFSGRMSTRK
jgi:hypothetical protein